MGIESALSLPPALLSGCPTEVGRLGVAVEDHPLHQLLDLVRLLSLSPSVDTESLSLAIVVFGGVKSSEVSSSLPNNEEEEEEEEEADFCVFECNCCWDVSDSCSSETSCDGGMTFNELC